MSFSSGVKDELTDFKTSTTQGEDVNMCCKHALKYGLLIFSRNFSINNIGMQSENIKIAVLYSGIIGSILGQEENVKISSAGKYSLTVNQPEHCAAILEKFGYSGKEIALRINRANLNDECCFGSFLRGAFLACGTISEPTKDYHLEFVVNHYNLSRDLIKLLEEMDLPPKFVVRKGNYVIYFKDSEVIEDVLTYMGATSAALKLMDIKIYKDVRNKVNRKTNFENANLSKTIDAAITQIEAIEKIQSEKGLSHLPAELMELAQLRADNPEMSLKELGEQLSYPISRSGVNHRLKKIIQIANDI
ncbi:MAG: DNA-binding protein WhiA [Oscillospiraceae bacterium]|jgi:DNA-binding protein WhiA|nr:DNA-binding protein WhiA [Oscillospiraceae bacterium]